MVGEFNRRKEVQFVKGSSLLHGQMMTVESWGRGVGGTLNFSLPVPFNPGSRPIFVGSRLFALF